MTRFDASKPPERRKLYVDAITAHRNRGSEFLTLEADRSVLESTDADTDTPLEESGGVSDTELEGPDPELGLPWIQFSDGTINLDCTDSELEALKALLGEFPAFKIDEIRRPEDATGVNVHVSAKADPNRIAQCLDAIFQRVYGLDESARVWVVGI
ncbi:hypothetical protein SAMN04487967_1812 [Natronorubrum sediminis]|uniref:DUF7975 domain-containing protein n=1 Tax=Natronorubrum sediminis TaxID=640943 RepID=A0A1H6FVP7_9EURY|nr:hypothetical protein [Natronorubrum sediminis]SEH14881.1 hypothetical protein SAMN04487967_1812 [Natronorubrum sediminis]